MARKKDLIGKRFGRLKVLEELPERKGGRIAWRCLCDCGEEIDVKGIYLTTEETKSCGCLKKDQDKINMREEYDSKRINGVVSPLFKGQEPRKDSSTGYRGVHKYYTRKSKEIRYRAWITIKGKKYYKAGFRTPEDAYYNGRLELERLHLPLLEDNNE